MACDYQAIRRDNERRYGTDIGRIGQILLADRYGDRTHFIFELLQNAEDALARRRDWQGTRSVGFHLTESALRVSHFGHPFNEADVRGICGIAESTKDLTAIGRFGIGFKSVYTFTDRPEIHSGDEDFAIESFVWPVGVPPMARDQDETLIILPFKSHDSQAFQDIARGLQRLGATTLLFLRQINEIDWCAEDGRSGFYLRQSSEIDACVRRVTVIGQEQEQREVEKTWLVFARPITAEGGRHAGHVEIAFSIAQDEKHRRETIQRVERSPLVVFFPTVVETYLGFLVQGPYHTTPSRDNVHRSDPWNERLVRETASLLVDALCWLRDNDLFDTATLRCLPLDPTEFGRTRLASAQDRHYARLLAPLFAPLFDAVRQALLSKPLLPRFDTGYVSATYARLARTQELRDLLTPSQLAVLFGQKHELPWLSGDITHERTPELRGYLTQELGIAEVTPERIISRLSKPFLEGQSDEWIVRLYEFLNGQTALRGQLGNVPLIRLQDGTHVVTHLNGQPQAFLPSAIKTGFPTVRASVCATETAREFLQELGLTEPDPVDDVAHNVLPKYWLDEVNISDTDYEADIRRILTAFATDSKGQREKLIAALQETAFLRAIDSGDGSKCVSKPGAVYLPTERLKELFVGIGGVLLVDDSYSYLRGEEVRVLLEACGATRYLQPVTVASTFTWEQLREMRLAAGCEGMSWAEPIEDQMLRGLDRLLALLPQLDPDSRRKKAALLWKALGELEDRRGSGIFSGTYRWHYYRRHPRTSFDAAFVRKLNETAWVPDSNGELQRPEFVLFDTLGWDPHPFLQSKIRFKPPIIETLAREAGIEPGVLDLLKQYGLTSEAELRDRLGLKHDPTEEVDRAPDNVENAPDPTPAVLDPPGREPSGSGGSGGGSGAGAGAKTGADRGKGSGTSGGNQDAGRAKGSETGAGKRASDSNGSRPFISYVGAHPDEEEPDPTGLDQSARMELEAQAIALILAHEPQWQRTTSHNPGFDLFEAGEDGTPTRWCEVKAMTGGLHDRPVGLSRRQFECAREHGETYWLYVVEHTGTDRARIVRIQDPAGKARTFTFDHGWLSVADVDSEQESDQTSTNNPD